MVGRRYHQMTHNQCRPLVLYLKRERARGRGRAKGTGRKSGSKERGREELRQDYYLCCGGESMGLV